MPLPIHRYHVLGGKELPVMIAWSIAFVLLCGLAAPLSAQTPSPASTVVQNVRIFDGTSGQLSGLSHVLVRGNRIERIASTPITSDRRADTVLIDGGGRTLMPGLIDMHWHTMLVRPTPATLLTADIGYLNLVAGAEATAALLCVFHGFLPPSPEECCHAIHGNVATQSRGFLPPSPRNVATLGA